MSTLNWAFYLLLRNKLLATKKGYFHVLLNVETAFFGKEECLNGRGKCQYDPDLIIMVKQKGLHSVEYKPFNMSGGE